MSPRRAAWLAAAALLLAAAASAQAAPAAGDYEAQLCVVLAEQPASCGPVQARLGRTALRLQVSDLVYRLQLHSSQLDVTLMHGTMQIDGFTAAYDWQGRTLRFADVDKNARYEVQLGARHGAAK